MIERARAGDVDAYGVLHQRHFGSAQALARRMSRSTADADDLVSEGFARVLAALQRGKGPDTAFRPYLLSTVRRLAYDRTNREQREAPVEHDLDEPTTPDRDPVVDGFEREAAAAAFSSLPERWRMVLWHTEVEGQSPAEVGELLGMKANAVAALAYRAREGLRQAYLTEHTPVGDGADQTCRRTTARLGAYVRGSLTPAREAQVRSHLDHCDHCQAAYLELASVNLSLQSLVGVAVLGGMGGIYALDRAALLTGGSAVAATAPGALGAPPTGAASTGPAATAGVGAAGRVRQVAVGAGVFVLLLALVASAYVAGRNDRGDGQAGATTSPPAEGIRPTPAPTSPPGSTATDTVTGPSTPTSAPAPAPTPTSTPRAEPGTGGAGTSGANGADRPGRPGVDPVRPVPGRPGTPPRPTPGPSAPLPLTPSRPTTPTTTPPFTTPTTTPPAPLRSTLDTTLSSAGGLVRGRPGVLVAQIANRGTGPARDVRFDVHLTGATLRGLPITAGPDDRGRQVSAWRCTAVDTTTLTCTGATVEPGDEQALYLPVTVPDTLDPVQVSASASAPGDTDGHGADASLTVPVQPSGLAARFATVDRGGIVVGGNALLTCPAAEVRCPAARQGGPGAPDNSSFSMVEIDGDDDPTTTNSSSATIDVPAGATVLSATAYWSADLSAGNGGRPAVDPAARGQAVFTGPDGVTHRLDAERVDDIGPRYQAVADVTDLLTDAGGGSWTLGGIQVGTGFNRYGGWSIVVAYRDASAPRRSLVVLDGFALVDSARSVSFDVGGFVVPPGGARSATIDVVTYEGDLAIAGDQLTVGGVDLSDGANPLGNSFNSTATTLGTPRPGLDPAAANLLGIDIDRFDVTGALRPGSTSTEIRFSTTDDVYLTGALAFAVDQGPSGR